MNGCGATLPSLQQAIQARCFHPAGDFVEFPREDVETSIPARFEKIARQFPGRIAVKSGTGSLTYQELNQAANQFAHLVLETLGEAPEPIAVLTQHDRSLFVAILGILKAGKICVVLDPAVPRARNSALLDDSQARIIVADGPSLPRAKEFAREQRRAVNVDDRPSERPVENPALPIAPDRFAFLIYTSGSTGQPKGVIQDHRNLLHDARIYCNGLHLSAEDRVALLQSCSVSQGLKVTFAALLSGAALCPYWVIHHTAAELASWLNREAITVYVSVPALFRHLAGSLTGERFPHLRILQLGSDVVTRRDLDLYRAHFSSGTVLIVRLGTTETGTLRRMFFDADTSLEGAAVPVGYGVENTDLSLLDDHGGEVAGDAVGEIAVRSRYISPGYWRRPELTRDAFAPDPAGTDARVYRTGDLGRMRPDGLLYHLGRKDFQLKVRGYRVEAAEIEALLQAERDVEESVVAVATGSPGDSDRLIAYIVPRGSPRPTVRALRAALGRALPAHMVPSDFVFVDSLPRTANGKIDRRALPQPGGDRPPLEVAFVAPRTDVEMELATLWEQHLRVRPIGIHDSFFDLGGHSLLATRLVSEVARRFRSDIPLRDLFASPTVAAMATLIGPVTERFPHRPAADPAAGDIASMPLVARDGPLPLSFAQRRMWFLNQLEPASPAYNQVKTLRLRGRLDRVVLQRALDAIVARHEALRTTFSCVDDQPVQVVHAPGEVPLELVPSMDLRPDAVERVAREFCRRPFDLQEEWPLRGLLVRCAEEDHVLVLVAHHIACDGWSADVLFGELSALYEAFSEKRPSPLEDLAVQYADYAAWQRERWHGDRLRRQLSYWSGQLAGLYPLELPTDRPRPAVSGRSGQTRRFRIPGALTASLKALSARANTTLSMALLAAFQTLLYRYTGQDDVAVGTPVAGRSHPETDTLIGMFVNTLVLRGDLSGHPSFRELLARVRTTAADAYGHQDVPFEKLVEELHPERDPSRHPLFQVMFQLRTYPHRSIRIGALQVEEYPIPTDVAKFDLSMALQDDGRGLAGALEYRVDLFDPSTIDRMIAHFEHLLVGVVADPDRGIDTYSLLSADEMQWLRRHSHGPRTDYPRDKRIHQLFEEQVERAPDAVAVVFGEARLSYRELNDRANQLAHHLRRHGVTPGALVGICMDPSLEMIVGILGILKAAGAYLPLDPGHSAERLAFALDDARASVVLTRAAGPRVDVSRPRIFVDRDWNAIAGESSANPVNVTARSDLAYAMYTSGSTGQPKGVTITHGAVVNHMLWMQGALRFRETDAIVQKTPITFDASVWEVFSPLIAGSRLVLAAAGGHRDPAYLCRLVREHRATVLQVVPSMLRALLREEDFVRCTTLRVIACGGEVLSPDLPRRVHAALGETSVWNLYGPTEACIDATYWECPRDDGDARVPIGRPIANATTHILDGRRALVPIGVTGEIHIGGEGVARGYLNRADLTAERFIEHSVQGGPPERLYRTGDLGRWLPDGTIEFLGRTDDQVKIRGHRIEPGEVEAALARHPAVAQAAVVAREDAPGEPRLIAYVVAHRDRPLSSQDLRRNLHAILPDHMVPAAFMFLDALPLTRGGKLDRRALPAPDRLGPERGDAVARARTPLQVAIADIWTEALGLDSVGIHDDFFDLGGHSLLAITVASRLRKMLGRDLPLRLVFESPTIEALARTLEARRGE